MATLRCAASHAHIRDQAVAVGAAAFRVKAAAASRGEAHVLQPGVVAYRRKHKPMRTSQAGPSGANRYTYTRQCNTGIWWSDEGRAAGSLRGQWHAHAQLLLIGLCICRNVDPVCTQAAQAARLRRSCGILRGKYRAMSWATHGGLWLCSSGNGADTG